VPAAHLSDAAGPVLLAQEPDVEAPPGRELRLSKDGKALQLACGDGSVLELLEVTLPGKKPVGAKAYWNGCKDGGSRWLTSADAEAALAPAADVA
jgi:methionyl-tRNA formyltransferase